eukprot:CAMPEP_0194261046 /NCGR_PEP_ID=MMETSP0158-20130606/45825_1 /TAXON_ID=33649 /ORGANISM="Thalassionema nitzschioides, Strain L26-B" /LENGTH=350 /DNA_ID=CAMNT_0039001153 /DNA_START=917 /DNA_END=1969 /DNA_ORIENTATION=+
MTCTILDNPAGEDATIVSRSIYSSIATPKKKSTIFLLDIFSRMNNLEEVRRRDLIRTTMLNRNQLSDPIKLCSLQEYLKMHKEEQDNCQIIYTFVVAGASETEEPFWSSFSKDNGKSRVPLLDMPTGETDLTVLNIRENMDQGKSTTWFDWASSSTLAPDYIGKVDSDTLLNIPSLLSVINGRLPPPTNNDDGIKLYGGDFVFPQPPYKQFMQGGFYFLSRHLAQCVSSKAAEQNRFHGPEDQRTAWLVLQCSGTEWLWCPPNPKLFLHPVKKEHSWRQYFDSIMSEDDVVVPMEQLCQPPNQLFEETDLFLKRFSDRNLYYGMGANKDLKSLLRSTSKTWNDGLPLTKV